MIIIILFIWFSYYRVRYYIDYCDNQEERQKDLAMAEKGYSIKWVDAGCEGWKKNYAKP